MDAQQQLLAAVASLWAVLTAVVSGALKWLLEDRKAITAEWTVRLTECQTESARKDAKLDEAADLLRRQNASLQGQIEALQALIDKRLPQ